MELEKRKKLYAELKGFDGGIKSVADALNMTTNHVCNVMTRFDKHKSIEVISIAVLAEIKKRMSEQRKRLRANFPELV